MINKISQSNLSISSIKKLNKAFKQLDEEVRLNNIPSAVSIVGKDNDIIGEHAIGKTIESNKHDNSVFINTIYDCASLTKAVVTLSLILFLINKGLLK